MEKKRWIIGILLMIVLIGVIYLLDIPIIQAIESMRIPCLDYFFSAISSSTNVIIIILVLVPLLLWNQNKKEFILPLFVSAGLSFIINSILKYIVARPRPYEGGIVYAVPMAISSAKINLFSNIFSFPSSHAIVIFSVLPILLKEFKKMRYILWIFACLVAFSRVYLGVHYMSDVVTGALIGYLIGNLILLIKEKTNLLSI